MEKLKEKFNNQCFFILQIEEDIAYIKKISKLKGQKINRNISYLYDLSMSHLIITLFKLLNHKDKHSIMSIRNEIEKGDFSLKKKLTEVDNIRREIMKLYHKCKINPARNKIIAHLDDSSLIYKYDENDLFLLCEKIKQYQSNLGVKIFGEQFIWSLHPELLTSFIDNQEIKIKLINLITEERLKGSKNIKINDLGKILRNKNF